MTSGAQWGVVRLSVWNVDRPSVLPRSAAIARFGPAYARAVNPTDAGQLRPAGAAVGVEHDPFLAGPVPDEHGIGRAIIDRVAEQRLGCSRLTPKRLSAEDDQHAEAEHSGYNDRP